VEVSEDDSWRNSFTVRISDPKPGKKH
jgi:hypothetical protein